MKHQCAELSEHNRVYHYNQPLYTETVKTIGLQWFICIDCINCSNGTDIAINSCPWCGAHLPIGKDEK